MKNWIKIPRNRMFFAILFMFISLNIFAAVIENHSLLAFAKTTLVVVILTYYLALNEYLKIGLICFFAFMFIGDVSMVLFKGDQIIKASSVAYAIGYLCLAVVIISKFKRFVFNKLVGVYLLTIFIINAYFLYVLFSILKVVIPDQIEVLLFAVKSISLLVLTFTAFALYLNFETKASIAFLVTSMCFVFSNILHYISYYYVYDWSFVMLEQIMHIAGLLILFRYMIGITSNFKNSIDNRHNSIKNVLLNNYRGTF